MIVVRDLSIGLVNNLVLICQLNVPDERWRNINIDFLSGMESVQKTKYNNVNVVMGKMDELHQLIQIQKLLRKLYKELINNPDLEL